MGNRNTRGVGPEGAEAHKRALKPVTLGESGQKGQRPTRERSNQCFSVSGRPRRFVAPSQLIVQLTWASLK
eukprot:5661988-Pyramimonas_sp.AAC.1